MKLADLKALIQLTGDQKWNERRKQFLQKQFLASRKLIKMAELNELNSFFYESLPFKKKFTFQFLTQFIMPWFVGLQRIGVDIEFYRQKF